MKSLYSIYESLLDDEDDIIDQGIDELISTGKHPTIKKLVRRYKGSPIKRENGVLIFNSSNLELNAANCEDLDVDAILNSGGIEVVDRYEIDGNKFVHQLKGEYMTLGTPIVKNLQLLCPETNYNKIGLGQVFRIETIENCDITFDSKFGSIHFNSIPTLKNVTSNCYDITIYNPSILDDKVFDKLITPTTIQYNTNDSVKVNTFKKLKAIINNPKKYDRRYEIEFPIDKSFSLESLIPGINKFYNLKLVQIRDNNVEIFFTKIKQDRVTKFIPIQLKDGWWVGMVKR